MRTQHNFNHRPHYRPFILKLWVFIFTQHCNIICNVTDQRADTELVVCLSKEQFYYQQAGVRLKAVLRRITGVCVCICVSVCVSQLTSMPRKLEISPLCLMWEESWVGAFVHTLVLSCSYLLFCVCHFSSHIRCSLYLLLCILCVCVVQGESWQVWSLINWGREPPPVRSCCCWLLPQWVPYLTLYSGGTWSLNMF